MISAANAAIDVYAGTDIAAHLDGVARVLRPAVAQLDREAGLLDLAPERPLAAGVEVAHELLRNRGSTLDYLARAEVAPERTRDPDVVDAAMLVEAAVLDRNRPPWKPLAHARERYRLAVSIGGDRPEQRAVGRVDEGVLANLDRLQRVQVAAD